ncbi:bifunctional riboflavin kinase/FAD synthetase [Clostridioides difficile]|nr:bifunctional riboflavin kinase/FMN adenylyltransferase [Clostridioides difficile]
MVIIKSIAEIANIKESVITIGNFDGIHKGHQVLIKKAVEYAKKENIQSIVFTFANHPVNYFRPNSTKNIISNEDKIKLLEELGIDIVVIIPFDEYMTKIPAKDFVEEILVKKLKAKKIVIGHDFTFARAKEGNVNLLKSLEDEFGFEVEIIKPIKINDVRVSSTYIRSLVSQGDMTNVKEYLGRNYRLEGCVIHSKHLGRTMGFPTANIDLKNNMLVPKRGIYASIVHIGDEVYFGATNVGYNPTVNGKSLSIETNILEFNRDIYGKNIIVEFLERIRDERKFNSIDDLKNQLSNDTNYVYENYVCKNR